MEFSTYQVVEVADPVLYLGEGGIPIFEKKNGSEPLFSLFFWIKGPCPLPPWIATRL